jgi:hypothetical protein
MSMLEYFFKSGWHVQNLRQGPLSKHIDGLAARLKRLGFTRGSGRRYLCLTVKFNDFARAERVETAEQITERLIERFRKEELPSHGIFKDARSAMHQLWDYLCEEKITTRSATTLGDDPFDIILRKYDEHLRNVRGLVPTSRSQLSGDGVL